MPTISNSHLAVYAARVTGRPLSPAAMADLARLQAVIPTALPHGDTWGSGDVLSPIPGRSDAMAYVDFANAEYPALAAWCEIRTPDEE